MRSLYIFWIMFANVILFHSFAFAQDTVKQPLRGVCVRGSSRGQAARSLRTGGVFRWCSLKARRDHLEQELPELSIRHIRSVVSLFRSLSRDIDFRVGCVHQG